MSKKIIEYADLFAGVGGFAAAMTAFNFEPAYSVEWDEAAANVYKDNWKHPAYGDITKDASDDVMKVPSHEILLGGFPCQPFSKSGAQLGEYETRGTLFWNILKILEKRRPVVVVLENVRNLVGPRHKATWATIIEELRLRGYVVSDEPAILSPHKLPPELGGRPQHRERVFITATYAPEVAREMKPQPVFRANEVIEGWDPSTWNLATDLTWDKVPEPGTQLTAAEQTWVNAWEDFLLQYRETTGSNPPGFPLWSDTWHNGIEEGFETMKPWKQDFIRKNQALYKENQSWIDKWLRDHEVRTPAFPPSRRKFEWQAGNLDSIRSGLYHFRPSGLRVKKPNYVPTLVAITQTSIFGPLGRRLSSREVSRLQGFPEWFDFGDQPYSATYKQMGNAVNVGAVYQVVRRHVARDRELILRQPRGAMLVKAVEEASSNPDEALENWGTSNEN